MSEKMLETKYWQTDRRSIVRNNLLWNSLSAMQINFY
jgi:hypothetical protein